MLGKFLIAVCVCGILALGGVAYLLERTFDEAQVPASPVFPVMVPEGAVVVTLTKDGFVPSELHIKEGDTVAFTNTTGELFWPASNLHPSHGIYPEFDPLEPVPAESVWSFTFDTIGEWRYHDHLAPYYTGVIFVE